MIYLNKYNLRYLNKFTGILIILLILNGCVITKIGISDDININYTTGPVTTERGAQKFIRIFKQNKSDSLFEIQSGEKFIFTSYNNEFIKKNEIVLKSRKLSKKEFRDLIDIFNINEFHNLKHKFNTVNIIKGNYRQIKISSKDYNKTLVYVNYKDELNFEIIEEAIKKLITKKTASNKN